MILNFLIGVEFVFIVLAYFGSIEWQAFVPATIYVLLAVADYKTKDRRLSALVLIFSVGISVPRLAIQYSDLKNKTASTEISSVEEIPIPSPYVPQITDCTQIDSYYYRNECIKTNMMENQAKSLRDREIYEIQNGIYKQKTVIKSESKLSIRESGLFFLFFVLSIAIPSGIYLLIHPAPKEPTPEEKLIESVSGMDDIEKIGKLLEFGMKWEEIKNHVSISKATYYRRLKKNEKKVIPKIIEIRREVAG